MMEGADYSSNNTIPEENESTASQSTPKTKPTPDEQGTNKSERASQKTNSSVKETADDSDKKSTTSRTSKNSADQNNDKQSVTNGKNSVVSERKLTISTIQRERSLVDPKEYEEAERVSKNTPKRSVENSVVYKPDQITDAKALSDRISLINPFSNDIPLPISFIMEPHTSTPLGNTQNPFNMFEMPPSVNNGAMSYRSAHYSDRPPTYLSDPTFARPTYGTMAVPTPNPYNYFPNNYSVVDTFSRRLSDPRLTAPAPTPMGLPGFPYPEVMFPGSLSLPAPSTNSENQSTTKKKKKKKKRRRFECLDDDGVYLPHTSIKKAKWRDVWDNLEISLMKKRKALEKAYKKLASAECHYIGDSAKHSKNRSHKCCLNGDTIPLCCHACPASRHPREYRQGEAPLEGRLYCSGYVPSDMANEKCYRLLPCEDNYEQEERQEKRRPSNATFVSFRSKTDNRGDANQNDLQDFQPYEEDEVVFRNNSVQYEGDDIPRQSLGASNLGFNNRDSVNYEQRSRPSRLENTIKKDFSNYNFEPNNRFSFSKSDHQRNSKQDHNSKDAGLPCEESVTEVNATLLRSIQVSLRSKKRNQCKTKKFNLDVDSAKVLRSLLCQSDSSPGLCTEQETTPGKKCPCANFAASCDAPWYCFPPSSKYAQCCRSSYQGTSQRKKPNACNTNDIFTSPTPFSCANIPDSIQARHLKRLMSHFYHDLVSLPARPDEDENDDDDGEDKENACSQHESFSCNTNRSNTVVVNAENLQTCAELHFLKRNSSTDREIERYIFEKEILTPLKINSRKKSSSKSLEDELDFLDFVRSERFIEECRKVSSGGSFSKKSSFSSRKSSKRNSTARRSQNETCVKNSIPCVKTLVDTGIQSCCMEEDPCCVPPTNDPCTKPPDPCNKMSCVSVTSSGVDKCKPTRPPRRRSVEEKVCLCPGEAVVCARNSDTACTSRLVISHKGSCDFQYSQHHASPQEITCIKDIYRCEPQCMPKKRTCVDIGCQHNKTCGRICDICPQDRTCDRTCETCPQDGTSCRLCTICPQDSTCDRKCKTCPEDSTSCRLCKVCPQEKSRVKNCDTCQEASTCGCCTNEEHPLCTCRADVCQPRCGKKTPKCCKRCGPHCMCSDGACCSTKTCRKNPASMSCCCRPSAQCSQSQSQAQCKGQNFQQCQSWKCQCCAPCCFTKQTRCQKNCPTPCEHAPCSTNTCLGPSTCLKECNSLCNPSPCSKNLCAGQTKCQNECNPVCYQSPCSTNPCAGQTKCNPLCYPSPCMANPCAGHDNPCRATCQTQRLKDNDCVSHYKVENVCNQTYSKVCGSQCRNPGSCTHNPCQVDTPGPWQKDARPISIKKNRCGKCQTTTCEASDRDCIPCCDPNSQCPNICYDKPCKDPNVCYDKSCKDPNVCYDKPCKDSNVCYDKSCKDPNVCYDKSCEDPNVCYDKSCEDPNVCCDQSCKDPNVCYDKPCKDPDSCYDKSCKDPNVCYEKSCKDPNSQSPCDSQGMPCRNPYENRPYEKSPQPNTPCQQKDCQSYKTRTENTNTDTRENPGQSKSQSKLCQVSTNVFTPCRDPNPQSPKDLNFKPCRDPKPQSPKDCNFKPCRDPNPQSSKDCNFKPCRDPNPQSPKDLNFKPCRDPKPQSPKDLNFKPCRDPNPQSPKDWNFKPCRDPNPQKPNDSKANPCKDSKQHYPRYWQGKPRLDLEETPVERIAKQSQSQEKQDRRYQNKINSTCSSSCTKLKQVKNHLHNKSPCADIDCRVAHNPRSEPKDSFKYSPYMKFKPIFRTPYISPVNLNTQPQHNVFAKKSVEYESKIVKPMNVSNTKGLAKAEFLHIHGQTKKRKIELSREKDAVVTPNQSETMVPYRDPLKDSIQKICPSQLDNVNLESPRQSETRGHKHFQGPSTDLTQKICHPMLDNCKVNKHLTRMISRKRKPQSSQSIGCQVSNKPLIKRMASNQFRDGEQCPVDLKTREDTSREDIRCEKSSARRICRKKDFLAPSKPAETTSKPGGPSRKMCAGKSQIHSRHSDSDTEEIYPREYSCLLGYWEKISSQRFSNGERVKQRSTSPPGASRTRKLTPGPCFGCNTVSTKMTSSSKTSLPDKSLSDESSSKKHEKQRSREIDRPAKVCPETEVKSLSVSSGSAEKQRPTQQPRCHCRQMPCFECSTVRSKDNAPRKSSRSGRHSPSSGSRTPGRLSPHSCLSYTNRRRGKGGDLKPRPDCPQVNSDTLQYQARRQHCQPGKKPSREVCAKQEAKKQEPDRDSSRESSRRSSSHSSRSASKKSAKNKNIPQPCVKCNCPKSPSYTDKKSPSYTEKKSPSYTDKKSPSYTEKKSPSYTEKKSPSYTEKKECRSQDVSVSLTCPGSNKCSDKNPNPNTLGCLGQKSRFSAYKCLCNNSEIKNARVVASTTKNDERCQENLDKRNRKSDLFYCNGSQSSSPTSTIILSVSKTLQKSHVDPCCASQPLEHPSRSLQLSVTGSVEGKCPWAPPADQVCLLKESSAHGDSYRPMNEYIPCFLCPQDLNEDTSNIESDGDYWDDVEYSLNSPSDCVSEGCQSQNCSNPPTSPPRKKASPKSKERETGSVSPRVKRSKQPSQSKVMSQKYISSNKNVSLRAVKKTKSFESIDLSDDVKRKRGKLLSPEPACDLGDETAEPKPVLDKIARYLEKSNSAEFWRYLYKVRNGESPTTAGKKVKNKKTVPCDDDEDVIPEQSSPHQTRHHDTDREIRKQKYFQQYMDTDMDLFSESSHTQMDEIEAPCLVRGEQADIFINVRRKKHTEDAEDTDGTRTSNRKARSKSEESHRACDSRCHILPNQNPNVVSIFISTDGAAYRERERSKSRSVLNGVQMYISVSEGSLTNPAPDVCGSTTSVASVELKPVKEVKEKKMVTKKKLLSTPSLSVSSRKQIARKTQGVSLNTGKVKTKTNSKVLKNSIVPKVKSKGSTSRIQEKLKSREKIVVGPRSRSCGALIGTKSSPTSRKRSSVKIPTDFLRRNLNKQRQLLNEIQMTIDYDLPRAQCMDYEDWLRLCGHPLDEYSSYFDGSVKVKKPFFTRDTSPEPSKHTPSSPSGESESSESPEIFKRRVVNDLNQIMVQDGYAFTPSPHVKKGSRRLKTNGTVEEDDSQKTRTHSVYRTSNSATSQTGLNGTVTNALFHQQHATRVGKKSFVKPKSESPKKNKAETKRPQACDDVCRFKRNKKPAEQVKGKKHPPLPSASPSPKNRKHNISADMVKRRIRASGTLQTQQRKDNSVKQKPYKSDALDYETHTTENSIAYSPFCRKLSPQRYAKSGPSRAKHFKLYSPPPLSEVNRFDEYEGSSDSNVSIRSSRSSPKKTAGTHFTSKKRYLDMKEVENVFSFSNTSDIRNTPPSVVLAKATQHGQNSATDMIEALLTEASEVDCLYSSENDEPDNIPFNTANTSITSDTTHNDMYTIKSELYDLDRFEEEYRVNEAKRLAEERGSGNTKEDTDRSSDQIETKMSEGGASIPEDVRPYRTMIRKRNCHVQCSLKPGRLTKPVPYEVEPRSKSLPRESTAPAEAGVKLPTPNSSSKFGLAANTRGEKWNTSIDQSKINHSFRKEIETNEKQTPEIQPGTADHAGSPNERPVPQTRKKLRAGLNHRVVFDLTQEPQPDPGDNKDSSQETGGNPARLESGRSGVGSTQESTSSRLDASFGRNGDKRSNLESVSKKWQETQRNHA